MAKTQRENFHHNLAAIVGAEGRGAVTALAETFGIHRVSMSRKIHGHEPFSLEEAEKIARHYGLSLTDMLVSPKEFSKNLASA